MKSSELPVSFLKASLPPFWASFVVAVVYCCLDFPFLSFPTPFLYLLAKELATVNDETLLSRIQDVLDERVKPVKGKIGMQRQRFRAVKMGVDLMLDVCRRTHNDLETEMEGKCFHMQRFTFFDGAFLSSMNQRNTNFCFVF